MRTDKPRRTRRGRCSCDRTSPRNSRRTSRRSSDRSRNRRGTDRRSSNCNRSRNRRTRARTRGRCTADSKGRPRRSKTIRHRSDTPTQSAKGRVDPQRGPRDDGRRREGSRSRRNPPKKSEERSLSAELWPPPWSFSSRSTGLSFSRAGASRRLTHRHVESARSLPAREYRGHNRREPRGASVPARRS